MSVVMESGVEMQTRSRMASGRRGDQTLQVGVMRKGPGSRLKFAQAGVAPRLSLSALTDLLAMELEAVPMRYMGSVRPYGDTQKPKAVSQEQSQPGPSEGKPVRKLAGRD